MLAPAGEKVELQHRQVQIAHPGVTLKETYFENARLARLGIEVMSYARLRSRTTRRALCLPERVHFYLLMLVTGGSGEHTVDCVTSPLLPGSLVLVRPGQVQQWHVKRNYAADIVMFDPAAIHPASTSMAGAALLDGCSACVRVPRASQAGALLDLSNLRREIHRYRGSELAAALIRQMLLVLLLRVMQWNLVSAQRGGSTAPRPGAYQLFVHRLETEYRKQHRVHYYARRLGYSASTLSRACFLAEGRSAKAVIDCRIALEAQRLLLHSHASYLEIGHYLGFSEASNFAKFFTRVVGRAPAVLRRRGRGGRA